MAFSVGGENGNSGLPPDNGEVTSPRRGSSAVSVARRRPIHTARFRTRQTSVASRSATRDKSDQKTPTLPKRSVFSSVKAGLEPCVPPRRDEPVAKTDWGVDSGCCLLFAPTSAEGNSDHSDDRESRLVARLNLQDSRLSTAISGKNRVLPNPRKPPQSARLRVLHGGPSTP